MVDVKQDVLHFACHCLTSDAMIFVTFVSVDVDSSQGSYCGKCIDNPERDGAISVSSTFGVVVTNRPEAVTSVSTATVNRRAQVVVFCYLSSLFNP